MGVGPILQIVGLLADCEKSGVDRIVLKPALQIDRQVGRAGVALGRLPRHGLEADRFQVPGNLVVQMPGTDRDLGRNPFAADSE